jgi:hypothetical protein
MRANFVKFKKDNIIKKCSQTHIKKTKDYFKKILLKIIAFIVNLNIFIES